jgi:DNA-directed RNA polymerase specialized sigma24 family protein
MKTKLSDYERDPEFWVYFREEKERLLRIDRTLATCRPEPMSFGEISDVMDIPYDSVRTIFRRAMCKMRSRAKRLGYLK